MLVFVVSWPTIAISGFGGARVAGTVASTSEPAVFSHAKAGLECGKGCHGLRLFLAEVSGSSQTLCLKAARASASGQSTICFFN